MSKPQKAGKISPGLERVVEECKEARTLDTTMLSGIIRFSQGVDYQALLTGFKEHYPGFRVVVPGRDVTIVGFRSPAKYINDLAGHKEVVEIKLPIEYIRS